MTNDILHAAIHGLNRTSDGFSVRLGKERLAISGTVQRVIDHLYTLYSRRASKSYGKFAADEDYSPTQKHLREYLENKPAAFWDLTSKMMTTLQKQAAHKSAAEGGHVLFSHFQREDNQYLLVTIITDKLGAALTSDYDMQDSVHLDLDGFRFAGRINITGWVKAEERYIGFLKGKGNVSEYFKEFLGCDTEIPNRQDTTDLVRALKGFAEAQGMTGASRDDFLTRAKMICDRYAKAREEIEFEALANELTPKSPDKLLETLTNPDLKLSDHFVPDRRALNSLVKFRAKTKWWSIEFEREGLSEGRVVYNSTENSLTLTGVPEELTAQLKHELPSDG